jgi:hypothetical protein
VLFTSFFAQSTAPQLDKIKQQDLKDNLYELAGDLFREEEEENLAKCELLFGWLKRPVKLALNLQAKMEPTSSSLISNAAVWQIVVLLV